MPKRPQDTLQDPILRHLRQDFISLRSGLTVAEALDTLRDKPIGEKIVYFYVTDTENRLQGVVPTRRLLMSPTQTRVEDLMVRNVVTVPASANVMTACDLFLKHRFLALPVVDDDGRMQGVVDIGLFTDEIRDVAEHERIEDAFQLIGVHLAHARTPAPWEGFRSRFPWLLCNITGGLICAFLAGRYESFLDAAIVIALFIPVVLALAESVSIQSTTITLQSLHAGGTSWGLVGLALTREFLIAVMLGLACGGLVGLTAMAWKQSTGVAIALTISIALSMVAACLLGVLLPAAVHIFKGDPKIAAGPIVLAITDIATLTLYLSLSVRVLA